MCESEFTTPIFRDRIFFAGINAWLYVRHPYLAAKFHRKVGYWPDIAFPRRYHEKIYWRKVFDRNPMFSMFCDKLKTKDYVKTKLPSIGVPETIWSGTSFNRDVYKLLTVDSIIKANRGSGYNLFPDQHAKGFGLTKKTVMRWLRRNYGERKLELAYRDAERKIFIEKMITIPELEPVDYYVRATDGIVLVTTILVNNKRSGKRVGYFDEAGKRLVQMEGESDFWLPRSYQVPATYQKTMEAARILSEGIDFARFDFLSSGKRLYAGEITVYPNSGMTRHKGDPVTDMNAFVNQFWDLRKSYFFVASHSGLMAAYRDALKRNLDKA